MIDRYRGRLGLQQRVLPYYRVPFFDLLAEACDGGLSVFAGQPRPNEGIVTSTPRVAKHSAGHNIQIFGGAFYLCVQRGLISWLSGWDPDVLVVEANPRYLATPTAVAWMHAHGRPVLGWGLGAPPLTGPLGSHRAARRWRFLQQFDGLIAYSRRGAEQYATAGFPRHRIKVATNSVAPRPSHDPERKLHTGQPNVLFVGRLQARKHVDFLLRAASEMPEPKPRVIIVGDGPDRRSLESLALQVYPGASFVGAKHGLDLDPYFDAADLFVLPGTGGLAVQDAMAHGLPVIVAKGDGTQEDLVRTANGWQIEPEDYAALVGAMRTALADPAKLRRMGAESFRIVRDEINLESMVAAFVRALNDVRPASR